MEAQAIVLKEPRNLDLETVALTEPGEGDVVVDVAYTGISAGTERLLWDGAMPEFPGMGYPLVPGYETVGVVTDGARSSLRPGDAVFVPGAHCYRDVRPLFGGAASRLVVPAARLHAIDAAEPEAALLALAATAHHAIAIGGAPELIIGHGVLGRLMARVTTALGAAPPTVHELSAARFGDEMHPVMHPDDDPRRDYRVLVDASGDHNVIDTAFARLGRGGCLVLAGFYGAQMSFAFPTAFMKEAQLKIAAEWDASDLLVVRSLLDAGALSLAGLVSHTSTPTDAAAAYATAFTDPDCLKMVLNWKSA